ncbi:acyltransferase family protein [Bosea vaviloviae]|uniref:acyltransferase family protein n=1 Tax=Bosea vaviloviae TaxID=1526658 RepID=UPI001313DDE5|nr:acyltransferase [Bosea vaviloviae]
MTQRLDHLDGLRGVAAVAVVIFHLMSALTPWLVPEQQPGAHWLAYTPLAVAWNGTFAVSVFFVLSGFVLTNATLRKSDPIWIDVPIRYMRLAIPATASTLAAWLLLSVFPTSATQLATLTGSRWLGWTYQGSIPGPAAAISNGMAGVFLSGGSFFNNVLWTMRPELLGSILCFAACAFARPRFRLAITLGSAVIFIALRRYDYVCFPLGIILREAWASGRLPSALPIFAMLLGLVIGSQSGDAAQLLGLDWLPEALKPDKKGGLLYPIAATLIVYGCLRSRRLAAALSGRIGRYLGAISFPLYLIHVPFIYTIVAEAYMRTNLHISARAGLLTGSLVLMFATAHAAERWLERPFLGLLGQLRGRLREFKAGRRNVHGAAG